MAKRRLSEGFSLSGSKQVRRFFFLPSDNFFFLNIFSIFHLATLSFLFVSIQTDVDSALSQGNHCYCCCCCCCQLGGGKTMTNQSDPGHFVQTVEAQQPSKAIKKKQGLKLRPSNLHWEQSKQLLFIDAGTLASLFPSFASSLCRLAADDCGGCLYKSLFSNWSGETCRPEHRMGDVTSVRNIGGFGGVGPPRLTPESLEAKFNRGLISIHRAEKNI